VRALLAVVALTACATNPATITAGTAPMSPLPIATVAIIRAPAIGYEAAQPIVVRTTAAIATTIPLPVASYNHHNPDVQRWYLTAIYAGWTDSDWVWLSCVIQRESHGLPHVVYRASRDRSYGLVQINAKAHRAAMIAYAGSEEAFLDPLVNLSFARLLYNEAGKTPWRANDGSCR